MKTISDITLYDLMAEDMDVWLAKNKEFGFKLQIDDENGQAIIDEKCIHPFAAQALADFCRMYLRNYDRIEGR